MYDWGGGQVIIWVQLTRDQRMYYKAIYEQKISFLLKGASYKNMPNLRNMVREDLLASMMTLMAFQPFVRHGDWDHFIFLHFLSITSFYEMS